ncbi:tRNA pseudouridine(55) synthase TruB [Mycoplasmopsis sturni]|uniref:tRNA pseudouridine(55) synthase TruB n=1 Tax=Mycoplasmopsis sturni TaxID=39047 RepID=UPI00055A975E|nr:tRNA pseudouridine(55) synthase TruB [Mycoplasmopsis sturni]
MFLKYYKPSGVFSNSQIRKIGRSLGTSKIGHNGTLDPMASGLMILATEDDTKLLQYLKDSKKTYIAQAKLFYSSETLDNYQVDLIEHPKIKIDQAKLQNAINKVKQYTEQIPPKVSAKKINGNRAYDLVRQGVDFSLKKQKIEIFELELIDFIESYFTFTIKLQISAGGYVRSVLRDIAQLLGTHCVMTSLVRTAIGDIDIDGMQEESIQEIPFEQLIDLPKIDYQESYKKELKNGARIKIQKPNGLYLMVNKELVLSVGMIEKGFYYPKKVFQERI